MYLVYLQSVFLFNINLLYTRSRNPTTTPRRNPTTTPRRNPTITPRRNPTTTPRRNGNQANTPQRRRKKTIPGCYDASCSTTTLRRHLANDHWEVWIMSCKKAGTEITSTSKEVRRAFDKFERKHGRGDNTMTSDGSLPVYRTYSPKAFLDAIVKWIVADDQVSLFYLFIVYYLCALFVIVCQCC